MSDRCFLSITIFGVKCKIFCKTLAFSTKLCIFVVIIKPTKLFPHVRHSEKYGQRSRTKAY